MKKIISLLMAVIFVFSMAMPTFAAVSANEAAQVNAVSVNDASSTNDIFGDIVDTLNRIINSIINFFKNLFGFGDDVGEYTITYYLDESKNEDEILYKVKCKEGAEIATVKVPTLPGKTFKGWKPLLPAVMPAEDIEVYATWSDKTYTLVFYTGKDGIEVKPIDALHGERVTLPLISIDNYQLLKWEDSNGNRYNPGAVISVNADMSFIAVWSEKITTITFDPDGGYWSNGSYDNYTISKPVGTAVEQPANPTRPGYDFIGWDGVVPQKQPVDNITFTAKWSAKTVKTMWVVDGVLKDTQTGKCGDDLSPNVIVTADKGYTFSGWKSSYDNIVYAVSDFPIEVPAEDTTFTAEFIANEYSYKFVDVNGTTLSSGIAKCGASVKAPVVSNATGCTFGGWKLSTDGSTVNDAYVTMPAANVTFTVIQTPNTYNIVWDVDGVKTTKPAPYGSEIVKPADPEKAGYVFNGWAGYTAGMTVPVDGATFTATWANSTDTKYVVEIYKMDTTGAYVKDNALTETKYGTTGAAVATGHADIEGFTFNESKSVLSGTIAANGSTALKVYYDRNKYTVTINGVAQECYYGATIKAPAATTQEGCTFAGWRGSDGKLYAAGADVTVPANDNFTLTAEFTPNDYTITFNVNGAVYQTLTFAYGADIIAPADPTMADMYFEGWSPALPKTMPANNLTVTATFSAVTTHKVTFHANAGTFVIKDVNDDITTSTTSSFNVNRGSVIPCPDAPTAPQGKRFIGWATFKEGNAYTEEDVLFTGIENSIKMTYSQDIYFYAVYVTSYCEVTYIVDGEEITVDEKYAVVQLDSMVDPSAVNPETMAEFADMYGYSFSGWSVKSENGVDKKPDAEGNLPAATEFKVTDETVSVVYTGKFVANKHNVKFEIGEGTWPEGTWKEGATVGVIEVAYDSDIVAPALPNPALKKVFLGWTDKKDSTEVIAEGLKIGTLTETKEDYNEDAEYTFYAVYVENEYEINFVEWDKENNTTKTASYTKTLAYGDAIDVSAYKPAEKTGYVQNETEGFKPAIPAEINLETLAELEKHGVVTTKEGTYTDTYGYETQYEIVVLTFTVQYEPVEYKIYFSGCDYLTVKVPCDANINEYVDAIPEAEGKTFKYWTDESGKQYGVWENEGASYNLGTMPPNNIELTAVWQKNTYTLSFNTDIGGTKIDPVVYEYGAAVTKPSDPTRTGYKFEGWEPAIPDNMPANDVTVVAKWIANDITIKFDTDGGQPAAIADVTQKYATNVTLPAAPTKTGHTFGGWLSSNGSTYNAGETIQMPSSNMTLTAVWNINQYTILIDTNGGSSVLGNYTNVDYGTPISETPEKAGHKLAGWYGWLTDTETEADAVYYAKLPSTVPDANMSFKAVWDCVDHYIYFHPETIPADDPETAENEKLTADKNMITVAFDCNADIITPTEAEIKAAGYNYETKIGVGKEIAGWVDEADTAIPSKMTYDMVGKHYVIDAWVDAVYTVTFNSNGGSEVDSLELNYGDAITEPVAPTKEGHTFVQWIDEKGYVVDFTNLKLDEAKDVTFTAVWAVNDYTVTWNIDGTKTTEKVEYGKLIPVPADPAKEGHTFNGWAGYTAGETTMGAADVEFVAQWIVNTYKATFDPNGGVLIVKDGNGNVILTTDEPYIMDILYGNPMATAAPSVETREGYVFSGWVDAEDKQPMPATMPAKDVTFNALWTGAEGVKYTVSYYEMNTEGIYTKNGAGEYISYSTLEGSGKTGTTASVTPAEREGFTVDTGMSSLLGQITADGALELKVFYSRNQYNLVTVVDGVETPTKYYYGATVADPVLPADTKEIDYPDTWTWSWTDADGTVMNTMPATMPATVVKASVTSSPMLYEIKLYSAGAIENPKVAYGTVFDVATLGTPKMEGYTFKNWTDADENGNVVTTITVTDNVKLYANWTPIVYTATFYNSDPATNVKTGEALGSKQIAYGNVVTYTAPSAPEGYSFNGWLADGELYDGKTDTMPAENMDFVAQWTAVTE